MENLSPAAQVAAIVMPCLVTICFFISISDSWGDIFGRRKKVMAEWRVYTMEELYDFLNKEKSTVFLKPTFPTRRWGQIYLKTSSTDISVINKGCILLTEAGFQVRKRLDRDAMEKFPNNGKFYKIEIKE